MDKDRGKTNRKQQRIPSWEWAVAAIGAAMVLSLIVFMGYRAVHEDSRVPDLHIEARKVQAVSGGFVVVIDVLNTGGSAANVAVEGTLTEAGATIESAALTLDYVPAQSRREAGVLFTHDPSRYQLQLRATGYETP